MAGTQICPYRPPTRWKRIDGWRAKAVDGSLVWMDMRGFVGLQQPKGTYVTFGASSVDAGVDGELHNGRHNPPGKSEPIRIYISDLQNWWKGGHQTKDELDQDSRKAILASLEKALKVLGYSVRYNRRNPGIHDIIS